MKAIHTGDIHLKIPEKKEEFYINRFLNFTELIGVDADEVILTGDLFDKSPTPLEVALMLGWIQNFDCPVYIVEGNHDRVNRKTIRANYLENLLTLMDFPNIVFSGSTPVTHNGYYLVSNRLIRSGFEIPIDKNLTLLSHIRHDLEFAGVKKKAEYDMEKLKGFKCCLLSDIHSTFKYSDNIYYSASPWRTHKKTIGNMSEIDDAFFGYNILEQGVISHIDCNLPNHYLLKSSKKVANSTYSGVIDIEYEICIEDIGDYAGEKIKIKHTDSEIEVQENLYELVYSILEEEYSIKEPKKYMDLLVDVIGEI